jgi:hypothetical protein
MTSKNVVIYKADNNLCFWFIVGVMEENVNFHTLNERHKVDLAKRTFKKFNHDLNWNTYPGVDIEKELVNFVQKLDKHFSIYTYNETKDQYKFKYDIGENENPELSGQSFDA